MDFQVSSKERWYRSPITMGWMSGADRMRPTTLGIRPPLTMVLRIAASKERLCSRRRVCTVRTSFFVGTNFSSFPTTSSCIMRSLFSSKIDSFFRKVTARISSSTLSRSRSLSM